VNEAVIISVENSFRERIRNDLLWLVTFAGGRIDFGRTKQAFYLSVREDMVAEALDGIIGCPYSGRFGAPSPTMWNLRTTLPSLPSTSCVRGLWSTLSPSSR